MSAGLPHQRLPAELRAAIVDLDGTMIDTAPDFDVALNAMLAELGLAPVDRDFVLHTIGKGSENLIRRTLVQVGAPDALFSTALTRYQAHYLAINGEHATVYPGVVEGLQRLRDRGWQLACVTNKPNAFAAPLLRAKGLAGFFGPVFGGDSFERKKPDPLPLLEACRALGSLPAQTLVLGDSSNDAQAARAAGCPVWLVRYGYNHGQAIESVDADGVLDRLDGLPLA